MPALRGLDVEHRARGKGAGTSLADTVPAGGLAAPGVVPVQGSHQVLRRGERAGGLAPGKCTPKGLVPAVEHEGGPADIGGADQELFGEVEARQHTKPVADRVRVGGIERDHVVVGTRVVLKGAHRKRPPVELRKARAHRVAGALKPFHTDVSCAQGGVRRPEEPGPGDVLPKLEHGHTRGRLRLGDPLFAKELLTHRSTEPVDRAHGREADDHGDHELDQGEPATTAMTHGASLLTQVTTVDAEIELRLGSSRLSKPHPLAVAASQSELRKALASTQSA